MSSSHPVLTTAAALGVVNHLYFKRYEPARTAIIQTAIIVLLQPTLLLLLFRQYTSFEISFSGIVSATLVFLASLTTSIIFYRLSPFHPLAKVPGPLLFRISKFWNLYLAWKGQQHVAFKELHDRYGPIVRTGPNDISVSDSESVKSVLGADGLGKGPGYLNFKRVHEPYPLIAMPKGEARHDRRRVWSRGFTSESIKEYQPIIVEKAAQLAEGLNARTKSEVDLGQWLSFFAFDFMADMMFGGGSGLLLDGKDTHGAMEVIRKGMGITQTMSHLPWFSHLARNIPAISENVNRLRAFGIDWCTRRIQNGAEKKDLWYHLTDEAGHEEVKPTPSVVASDSVLAIIAGSDTTSTAMTNLFWCLMAHPTTYKQLREEVDREYPAGVDPLVDTSRFGNMKYLNACLNESLRLIPPVPSSGPRVVTKGSGGKVISGQ
ncbi:hypothetical protein PM082_006573 [Marasmius tenuissimus]|nr:hypothetical protein PM082_006573 [Marasmius tenuissimus]